ncbi:MAG: tripartite tricarboxylate transporter substrate binding protein [Rhizobiales bacterium]|nr:tripartite tricarboxylate transporter substrate binding protein [Hyphomicrobiales bacterium]
MSCCNIRAQAFAGALLAAVATAPAWGQSDYPSRNVTIIVSVSPGSQADMFARLIADQLSTRLGKPVIVENRPGGGQVVGGAAAAKANADGHTLFHGNLSGLIISPQLRNPQPYNTPKDFTPITLTFSGPSVLVVDPKLPIKDVKELIAYAKANPGKLNYGSHGAGSFTHVSTEMFKGITGTDMVHIPFSGGGPLTVGFLSGQVQVVIFDLVSVRAHVESGKARVIAQVGDQRSPLYPDVPLLSETLDPALATDFWMGMVAPAGTPPAVIARLNKEITEIVNIPNIKATGEAASMSPAPMPVKAFGDKLAKEWALWGKVIKDRNIQVR